MIKLKRFGFMALLLLVILRRVTGTGAAQSPISVTVHQSSTGPTVSSNFQGLSYETLLIFPDSSGNFLFSGTNTPLINMFKTLGIKSLRIGGNSADNVINCGGTAVSPFVADEDFAGGGTINHANTIDLSGVTNPAPMAVYQTARVGNFTYTIPGFAAGSSHTVRLHFAETFFSSSGSRTFNVSINGTQVLTSFDIFAAAGAKNKAIVEQFTASANSSGQYVLQFTSVVNQSLISGIEIQ